MYAYDFKPKQKAINFTEVFVVMPFGDEYDAIFEKLIKPATEETNKILNLTGHQALIPDRVKDDIRTESGWINVLEHLLTAQVIIGVLTDNNANVFYELGIAHAVEPKTRQVLVANKDYVAKFDTKDLIYYPYEYDLVQSIKPLGERIAKAVESYKIEEERKINQARMLIGPYEFEVVMLHYMRPNFVLHTSSQGRHDYEMALRSMQKENYVEGAFDRHVAAIRYLCQEGLLGLNTDTKPSDKGSVVYFSYHWTELGNSVLHLMKLISLEELKNRRDSLPAHFKEK